MKYASEYKCRLCGEILRSEAQEIDTKEMLEKDKDSLTSGKSVFYWVHICKDGSVGFCDFQGHKAVKE